MERDRELQRVYIYIYIWVYLLWPMCEQLEEVDQVFQGQYYTYPLLYLSKTHLWNRPAAPKSICDTCSNICEKLDAVYQGLQKGYYICFWLDVSWKLQDVDHQLPNRYLNVLLIEYGWVRDMHNMQWGSEVTQWILSIWAGHMIRSLGIYIYIYIYIYKLYVWYERVPFLHSF